MKISDRNLGIKEKIQLLAEKSINLKKYNSNSDPGYYSQDFPRLVNVKEKDKEIFYPLAQSTWGLEEHKVIIDQLKTGQLTMGKNVEKFEENFANFFGSKYAIMVNSGSSANLIMIAAITLLSKFNFNKGDEVIVPALGWSTSFSPFSQYGIKLKFIDIKSSTLNIDENKIEDAISKKTRAILAINILGNPVEFNKIKKICKKNNLLLIEDNCESLGARYKSKYAGSLGLASSHSFFFSHHIQTIEGGMITTNDKDICEYSRSLRAHGWTRDSLENIFKENSPLEKFHNSFKFMLPGYNVRPNEFNGILGTTQLKKLPYFLKRRKNNANLFLNLFKNKNYCKVQECEHESSWYGFSLILTGNLKNKRDLVLNELFKNGIETRPVVTGNFLKNSACNFMNYEISGILKNVEEVDRNGFFVGNSHINLENQLFRLSEILEKCNNK